MVDLSCSMCWSFNFLLLSPPFTPLKNYFNKISLTFSTLCCIFHVCYHFKNLLIFLMFMCSFKKWHHVLVSPFWRWRLQHSLDVFLCSLHTGFFFSLIPSSLVVILILSFTLDTFLKGWRILISLPLFFEWWVRKLPMGLAVQASRFRQVGGSDLREFPALSIPGHFS